MWALYLRDHPFESEESAGHKELGDMTEAEFEDWCAAVREYVGEAGHDRWKAEARKEWEAARAVKISESEQ